jgi:hypothetical protein
MHDSEPDTFVQKTWPEKVCDMLNEIGVDAKANEIGKGDVEFDDYYSRYFVSTPRMVTNKGSLEVKGSNIDVIQIIQKG